MLKVNAMNMMKKSYIRTRSLQVVSALATAVIAMALTGCTLSTTAPATDSFNESSTGTISGTVHGGQFAIYNATVSLYAAGTTGYGSSGGTALATTTTGANGTFQFTKLANGSTNSGSSWSCPSNDPNPDPQIYIISVGGNTQGTGVTSTNNTAAALIAALGPCSTITSSTQVQLNELTTVATVFALAPYINAGQLPGSETIGTNGANSSTATPQAAVGLNNAVSTIANLASVSTGNVVTANTYTGTNSSVNAVTVTATPETAKIVTIANILASCINQPSSSANNCTDLFNAAVAPASTSTTSGSTTTFHTAQDTIQAAYYMAINPAETGSITCNANSGASTGRLACLYDLSAASGAPFQTGLGSAPTDWTIGVTFTASGTCHHDSWPFFDAPAKVAVDATGNLWFVNGNSGAALATAAPFGGISPVGMPLACEGYSNGAGQNGAGIAVDPSGNIWASYIGSSSSSTGSDLVQELPASIITSATSATLWQPPFASYALTVDGGGNVFFSSGSHVHPGQGGQLYELPNPGPTSYSPTNGTVYTNGTGYSSANIFPATLMGTGYISSTSAILPAYIAADHSGNIWIVNSSNENVYVSTPTSLTVSGYTVATGNAVTFYTTTAPPATIVTGQDIVVTGLTSTEGVMMDHQGYTVTSISTGTPYSITASLITSPSTTSSASTVSPTSPTLATVSTKVTDSGTLTGYTNGTWVEPSTDPVYGLAVDSNGYLYTGGTCCGNTNDSTLIKVTPGTTAATLTSGATDSVSAQYIGGLNGVSAIALDGADNIWFGNVFPSTGTTASTGSYFVGEASSSGSGTSATFSALSPAGTTPSTCTQTPTSTVAPGCPTGGGFVKANFLVPYDLAIDPSGNVWVPATGYYVYTSGSSATSTFTYNGTSITEIVGAAVPVVTPFSVAAGAGTLATKP